MGLLRLLMNLDIIKPLSTPLENWGKEWKKDIWVETKGSSKNRWESDVGLTMRSFSRRLVTWKRATPEGAEPRAERVSKGWWYTTDLDAFQRWGKPNCREKGISTGSIREPYPKPEEGSAARSELSSPSPPSINRKI